MSELKRLLYFTGQVLTAEALQLEQQYFREKLKRHNRSLHGFGIVSGLEVSVSAGQLIVTPGIALDCEGNEIIVCEKQMFPLAAMKDCHAAYVSIRFAEEAGDFVPVAGNDTEAMAPSTLQESFELVLDQENHNRGHRHMRARWLGCGQPHPLTIAKLRHGQQGWRVDRGYRPPAVK